MIYIYLFIFLLILFFIFTFIITFIFSLKKVNNLNSKINNFPIVEDIIPKISKNELYNWNFSNIVHDILNLEYRLAFSNGTISNKTIKINTRLFLNNPDIFFKLSHIPNNYKKQIFAILQARKVNTEKWYDVDIEKISLSNNKKIIYFSGNTSKLKKSTSFYSKNYENIIEKLDNLDNNIKKKITWNIILNDKTGFIQFNIGDKQALYFSIKENITTMNSYYEKWDNDIKLSVQFNTLKRPLKFIISFDISDGFTIEYKNQEIGKYPNKFNITNAKDITINKSDSIIIYEISPLNRLNKNKNSIEKKIMYGPWVDGEKVTDIEFLDNNNIVYLIEEGPYTKMVSSTGEEKYYKGKINDFESSDWETYSNTGGGKYLIKNFQLKKLLYLENPHWTKLIFDTRKLNDGKIIYLLYNPEWNFTFMKSSSGEQKYYEGNISQFDPSKWDTYKKFPFTLDINDASVVMYGPWIGTEKKPEIKLLNDGRFVYLIEDGPFTKMVSSSGEEKYYEGNISQFDPSKWDNYKSTGGGKYLIKDSSVVMYGPWIGTEKIPEVKKLDYGGVYLIEDGPFTKMVSTSGEEKYYEGNISQFDPSKWMNYNSTGGGKYLIKSI